MRWPFEAEALVFAVGVSSEKRRRRSKLDRSSGKQRMLCCGRCGRTRRRRVGWPRLGRLGLLTPQQ